MHHGTISLHAVVIQLPFGNSGFLHQIDHEFVLFAGNPVAPVGLAIGGTLIGASNPGIPSSTPVSIISTSG
jgi:hypothetical protein